MRDSDSEKDVTATFRCSKERRSRATEHPDLNQSEVFRTGTQIVMDGKEFAEAEHVNDRVFEVLSLVESEFRPIEEELSNMAPELAERLREARLSVAHEATDGCYERVQCAESEADARATDPEAASPGVSISPADAARELLMPDSTDRHPATERLPDRCINEGPENLGVQHWAEKCGMDPVEFWEVVQETMPAVALVTESEAVHSGSPDVATDGGDSS